MTSNLVHWLKLHVPLACPSDTIGTIYPGTYLPVIWHFLAPEGGVCFIVMLYMHWKEYLPCKRSIALC